MAEFKEAPLWLKISMFMGLLSFTLVLFSYPSGFSSVTQGSSEACLAIAFMAILVAVILVLCIVLLDEVKSNKAAKICLIVFALVGGVAELIGLSLLDYDCGSGNYICAGGANTFTGLLGAFGAFLALLCGIFAILDLVGVGASKA